MATRDAAVRATLESSSYIAGLRRMGDETKRMSKESGSALKKSLGDGARAGVGSLKEIGSELKNTIKMAVSLGGALSVGGGVKGAMELVSSYRDIAFAIQAGTGAATDWRTVQKEVEAVGERWKVSNQEVARSYRALWDDIGDADYVAAAVNEVSKAVAAGAGSFDSLTSIAGALNEKFGITKEELPKAMAAAISLGNKGGASVEGLGDKLSLVGASAKRAGLGGEKGFEKIGAMLNFANDGAGSLKKNMGAVSGLLDALGNSGAVKQMEKAIGVKLTTKGVVDQDAIEKILQKSGGKKEIISKLGLSVDSAGLVEEFGKTYAAAHDAMAGDAKAKMKAGVDAYHRALETAGHVTLTAAQLEAQAKARLLEPSRNLDDAMNKFTAAFSKPEMIAAMDKLSASMPKLAEMIAKVVGVAVDHPKEAAAAVVAAKVAPAVGAGVVGSLVKNAAQKGMFGKIGQFFAGGAKVAGAAASTVAEGGATAVRAAPLLAEGGAAVLAGAGATIAALAAWVAVIDQGVKLHGESKASGGVWKNFKEAREMHITGKGMAKAMTPEEYDARHGRLPPPPTSHGRGGRPAIDKVSREIAAHVRGHVPEAARSGEVTTAVDGLKKGGKAGSDVARSLTDASRAAKDFAATLRSYRGPSGAPGGDPSKGPVGGLGNAPGSAPMPANR